MQILASFQQQHIPMVSGHQDNSYMAMALAMSRAKQDPAAAFAGLPGFWREGLG
jgi:hypothetical protein